jgi:3-oxoacyl-[acyl-carrier protein] reductase
MDLGISGKWALVCGASKGLGLACAQHLSEAGVHVVMVARQAAALEAAASALRNAPGAGQVLTVAADVTTEAGRDVIWAAAGGPGKDYDIVITNVALQQATSAIGAVTNGCQPLMPIC